MKTKKIIRVNRKSKRIFTVILAGLILALIRLICGLLLNVDLDEGQLIYDAHLFRNGYTPFVDFTTRSPLIIYLLALVEGMTGSFTLINAKILITLLYFLGYIVAYLLIKEMGFTHSISLKSSVLIFLTPYILYYSYVLHVAQSFAPIVLIFVFFLNNFLKKGHLGWLLISATTLGFAYLIRRETLVLLAPSIISIIALSKKHTTKKIKDCLIFLFTVFLSFFLIAAPFFKGVGIKGFNNFYGIKSLQNKMIVKNKIGSISNGASFIETVSKLKFFSQAKVYLILNWLFIIFPLTYFTSALILRFMLNWLNTKYLKATSANVNKIVKIILFLFSMSGVAISFFLDGKNGSYTLLQRPIFIQYVLLNLLISHLTRLDYSCQTFLEKNKKTIFLFFSIILFSLVIMFLGLETLNLSYFTTTTLLLCVVVIPIIINNINNINLKKYQKTLLCVLFVFNYLIIFFDFIAYTSHARGYSWKFVNKCSEKVTKLSLGYPVFTADTTIIANSNHEIYPLITHHGIYVNKNCVDIKNLPCLDSFSDELEKNNIELLVIGFRSNQLIQQNKKLEKYINENYDIIDYIDENGKFAQFYKKIKNE